MSTQNATRIVRYRGRLAPLHVVGSETLSRSDRNGNYYLSVRGDAQMVSVQAASQWLSRHGLPQFSDTAIWAETVPVQS